MENKIIFRRWLGCIEETTESDGKKYFIISYPKGGGTIVFDRKLTKAKKKYVEAMDMWSVICEAITISHMMRLSYTLAEVTEYVLARDKHIKNKGYIPDRWKYSKIEKEAWGNHIEEQQKYETN